MVSFMKFLNVSVYTLLLVVGINHYLLACSFFDLGKCWFTYSLDTFLICITSALFSPEGGNRIIPTGCYFDKLSPKYMQKVGHSDTGPTPIRFYPNI